MHKSLLDFKITWKFSLDSIIAYKVHTARQSLSLFLLLLKREKVLSIPAVL